MRKITLLFLLLTASLHAQEFTSANDYLTYIDKETSPISKSTWKYTSAIAHSKSGRKIDATRKQLVKTIQNASKKIKALQNGFKGDVEYRDQILAYLDISEKHINEEYDKIINMQEVAEQSYDAMEAYILMRDMVNEKIDAEVDKLNANQRTFAAKYGIQITEDNSELGKKMKISNEVFENHTQLYLIFFKVNFTEGSFMNAMQNNDLNAMQQNANAMKQYADEGIEKLKTFEAYKKDPMLVNATKNYLEFCKKEADELSPVSVSYTMLNLKVQESQKTLENKKEKDRTNEEIDNYNKLVSQMNKEVVAFNRINNKYNAERAKTINLWNQTGDNFISKHVPID